LLKESQSSLTKAVELAPDRKLYRNNLATVYVEQGQLDLALAELTAAHGQAAGHYNLGYLLAKKGDREAALSHFQQAAAFDPTLAAAQQWVAKLSPPAATSPAFEAATTPHVAQRNVIMYSTPPATQQLPMPPQPGTAPGNSQPSQGSSQGAVTNPWAAPPSAVRYPNQQSNYSGAAALPPTPDQVR
jgi:tetratricopeptide (TPR) repeat protein